MSQNHYQVLGVSAAASAHDIKVAYKRLAVQYHPDKHGGSTLYEELFKAVATAYHVLGHPDRRLQYDYQLQVAARRAEEARRQQEFRNQGQRVYGVPMPPPAPLRTRRPAGAHERHYRPIPRQKTVFTRRDYWMAALLIAGFLLFILSVKVTMDHVSGVRNYERGLKAYVEQNWEGAHSYFTDALHFKPGYAPALQRRGQIEQLVHKNYAAAEQDFRAALPAVSTHQQGRLWLRIGQCQAGLGQTQAAQTAYRQALDLDSTLARAWLLRGEDHLFGQNDFRRAARAFSQGLRHEPASSRLRSRLLTFRGLAHYKLKHYDAARRDYWEVLEITPRSGQVYFLLGRLAQQEQDREHACEYFRRAVVQGYAFARAARDTTCTGR
ncbi:J domain-containing protein [Hymenobacter perfusus]|uniref:Tetratricopeptide repeat protein n=1 Tax=Hymenobacter perfusus TaxID=1236770 RepID=A0A3R9P8V8_9BACT|nr:J domain-containing protein [Hymenobacter perfusus]RSK46715.1 tetratricopeptide repeat protein [Hymenobacter perfusus]